MPIALHIITKLCFFYNFLTTVTLPQHYCHITQFVANEPFNRDGSRLGQGMN